MPTLQFKGKAFVQNHHLGVKFHQWVPVSENSRTTDEPNLKDNLIIEGDNLLALKSLLPLYGGRIKCVCIDPPYNTGNEGWQYNDNVNSPMMQDWLGKVVDREDLTRHDKWLCMMMPRLKLLRELMSDDGSIWVFCDDNEQHHLRMLMDEIFGEENFVAAVIWQKIFSPRSTAQYFSENHDYILVYSKKLEKWNLNLFDRSDEQDSRYKNPDDDSRGVWTSGDLTARNYYSLGIYPITTPSGRVIEGPPKGTYWRVSEKKFKQLDKDKRIWWGDSGNNVPRLKRFLSEVKKGIVPQTIWSHVEAGNTQEAKKELLEVLSDIKDVFLTPKPTRLIERILKIATNPGDIILDSFAGSGTTGQAVLSLNQEDENGEPRKFILVEMESYANSLTAERIRSVINGIPTAKNENLREGLEGTFSYFKLGVPIEMEGILHGTALPAYEELARYVFYTATGEEFDVSNINNVDSNRPFIGESKRYEVYLFYRPDLQYLKSTALTLDSAHALGESTGKKRLVFAPMKYLDPDYLDQFNIEYCQLPFEIYRFKN